MVIFTLRPHKCCLLIWDVVIDMPDTPFLFLQCYLSLLRWFYYQKGVFYIMNIIWRLYFLMFIYSLSRCFPMPKMYFDIKMAISHNKQTRLLDIITYPLNYLICGLSWKCPPFCPVLWDLPCHFLALHFFFSKQTYKSEHATVGVLPDLSTRKKSYFCFP